MMEENNLKWLHLFQKILKPGCSFRDYIEFMATVNPNSKGLDIKSRQAVTILSKKKLGMHLTEVHTIPCGS